MKAVNRYGESDPLGKNFVELSSRSFFVCVRK